MYIRRHLRGIDAMNRRKICSKEQNRRWDAVYHLRNRKKRNEQAKVRASAEEQVLYRSLYARWRYAISGKKIDANESFDKPDKPTRLLILKKKLNGCAFCSKQNNLQLDHIDAYPNNNSLKNLQWLCSTCHKLKTEKERLDGLYSKHEKLAKKKPWSRTENAKINR